MNIPLGTQEIAGKELSEELLRDVISFMDSSKTGYFCVTSEGENGIEDALLVLESGNVVGAHYAYLGFGTEYNAGEALKRVLNSFLATKGIYDSYTLSSQQLELLKIFNEGVLLLERIPLRSLEGMMPVSYSKEFERQELKAKPAAREDVLQKHGLTEIKVDNYNEIKSEMESISTKTDSPEKVVEEVDKYLSGGEEKKEEPAPKPAEPVKQPPEDPTADLEKLNTQAEKLKKLLLKEK